MATKIPEADADKPTGFAAIDAIAVEAAEVAKTDDATETAEVAETPAIAPAPAPVAARAAAMSKSAKARPFAKTAVETAETATVEVAPNPQKDVTAMATQFETPKMFADVNERAKSALEKSGKLVSEFGEFGKGNVEALVESTRIAAKGVEAMGQDAADYTRRSFEGMTATLKSLATVKSPTEFFKLQSDYARSAFDAAVQQSSKSTEMMMKLAGDAAKPLSNRFALAAEKVKTAA